MSKILKTTDLCKSFSGQSVVNNLSLNIEKNSVYGLLGPNGAGKSTTLKMITGILRPTSGSIEFDGHTWKRSDLNHIGALIEMPPLYENLTAYENLKVRTIILGLPDKRIDEVLQVVRLTGTVYIMPNGSSYHTRMDCSSVVSYVREVPLREVKHLGACSYCGEGGKE